MRALILLFVLSAPVMANDTCKQIGDYAATMMKAHQSSVPMSTIMEVVNTDLGRQIAMDAYSKPRYVMDEMRERMIADFRDVWYLACMRSMT